MTREGLARELFYIDRALIKTEASAVVDDVFALIATTLASGDDVKLSGFGKFIVREKKARPGMDLRTRQPIVLPARRVVRFRASPTLRAVVNSSVDSE